MKLFYFKFKRKTSGRVVIASFNYDGLGNQAPMTFDEWKKHCIDHWRREGWTYLGEATAEEWINR